MDAADQHLHREDGGRDRRVERGGDAARRAARHQRAEVAAAQPGPTADRRSNCGADLYHRPLTAGRPAETYGQRRGDHLDSHDPLADVAAAGGQRGHHFRHAVPLRLPREAVDDRSDQQPAQRRQQHELGRTEPLQEPRHRPTSKGGRQLQHVDEADRAEAGDHADDYRQDDEVVLLGEKRRAQPHPRPFPDGNAGRERPGNGPRRGDGAAEPPGKLLFVGHRALPLALGVCRRVRQVGWLHDRELHPHAAP